MFEKGKTKIKKANPHMTVVNHFASREKLSKYYKYDHIILLLVLHSPQTGQWRIT